MCIAEVSPKTLELLLDRVGEGDRAAFRDLHGLCAKRLLPFARRIVRSRESADEVMQESFLAIWSHAVRFDRTRSAAMTWMITIVRNKAIDSLRANARHDMLGAPDSHDPAFACFDHAAGPCEAAELAQRGRLLRAGMSVLASLPRQAIELAFFHDMTHDEVALEMTIPLGTVKTWIRRGCKQIRLQLMPSGVAIGGSLHSSASASAQAGSFPG